MADIKLFSINGIIKEIPSGNVTLERELQIIIEKNMYTFFGVNFLASEYSTTDGGRMDSIGIDENYCPVIFEYKRSMNENVINQGLFYLNWLLDHKDSFKLLVLEKFDKNIATQIDWTMPRVICIAGDFNKYDESAIKQMNRNISLIRYKKFGNDLLMFEMLDQNVVKQIEEITDSKSKTRADKTFEEKLSSADKKIQSLYEEIKNYILSLGDDVSETKLKLYTAFKKIKNVVCVEVQKSKITLTLKLDVISVKFEDGFIRDVTNIGHWGTGNIEIEIKNEEDLDKAKPYINRAYQEN